MKGFALLFIAVALLASYGFAQTWAGSGTAADPYIVTTCTELQDLSEEMNDGSIYFNLGNDIDCSASETWEGGAGFRPIGLGSDCETDNNSFEGHFDGKGFEVTELFVKRSAFHLGMFSCVIDGGSVRNVALIDFNIVVLGNNDRVGTLAGLVGGSDVNNVYAYGGSVWGDEIDFYIGGLIGYTINDQVGGDANVENSYVDNVVVTADSATANVGGFSGKAQGNAVTHSDIQKTYSTALVNSGAAASTGGYIGADDGDVDYVANYWDTQTSTQALARVGATGLTTANAKKQASYVGWDFDNVWFIDEDQNYPVLRQFAAVPADVDIDANVVALEGFPFASEMPVFVSGADTNLTIDFNVFEEGNRRMTAKINYSTVATQGTGVVIVQDLNLDADICDDLDFDGPPTQCHWDWDITGVGDGNYFILVEIASSENFDFNASERSVKLVTTVGLIVKVPINEETNVVIDMVTYSFIVRIFDGNVRQEFSVNTDDNTFAVPPLTNLTVEIDTNAPAVFNSRQYIFNFSFGVSEFFTLQPYLPPVSASILTTVKARRYENLVPIPGIGLKIFKFFGGGRTLVHDAVTDEKGEAAIPFVIADEYSIEVYQEGVLISTQAYTATSTTSEYFIYIAGGGVVVVSDQPDVPTVAFDPGVSHHDTTDLNIVITAASRRSLISSIKYEVINAGTTVLTVIDTSIPADGNSYTIIVREILGSLDTNRSIDVNVSLTMVDGNVYVFFKSYTVSGVMLNLLIYQMREDFGCPSDLSQTCAPLLFIAFFIIIFLVGGFAAGISTNGFGLTILAMVAIVFFIFIAWIPLWLGFMMIFAGIGVILNRARFN